jgi:hypothetical protein
VFSLPPTMSCGDDETLWRKRTVWLGIPGRLRVEHFH